MSMFVTVEVVCEITGCSETESFDVDPRTPYPIDIARDHFAGLKWTLYEDLNMSFCPSHPHRAGQNGE